ncbi:endonuclease [Lacipirellula parvula]|uniref:Extracellular ribonuclease Bsn n=1 Tax=Lacipirellula parvula TaxID=2650471 RepID=A0A5K7XAX2_9BACT|nr:endonuclease [Lacipirellula parvula]BBO33678.1 extracellular ribonuclease Bsn [Lacipirellula parvula]
MRSSPLLLAVVCALASLPRLATAQSYDPPANYYATATGTGATLKSQLHDIIDGHTVISYDGARSALQVTDADPAKPGYMLTAYDRTSLHVAAINPGGSPPGWDSGATWNREHTWPRSRGVETSGPDDSDLFALRPALTSGNGDRANYNFGGTFGQAYGLKPSGTSDRPYWYPGDADAGMIARQEFYMAVRYDGSDSNTRNLELVSGNPTASNTAATLGNLDNLIQWHYAAVPDAFERRRNQVIYDDYQHNRNPFTDRPEYVWSIFMNQTNDSSLSFQGGTTGADGGSTLAVDMGRVIVGGAVPAAKSITLNKAGLNGTYYSVTTAGAATSTVSGRYNAFNTGVTGSRSINVGLTTSTAAAGLKTGTVTVDNLDVTNAGGAGRGANDANDVATVNLSVLSHANPSFAAGSDANSLTYDFGTIALGGPVPTFAFDLFNLEATAGYTAGLDLDAILGSGDTAAFSTTLSPFQGAATLAAGAGYGFTASMNTLAPGAFSVTYSLNFSDENLSGAASLGAMSLTLSGVVSAAPVDNADFNGDGFVDGADFLSWQRGFGGSASLATGDANGDGLVDAADLVIWQTQFGAGGSPLASVPEPTACCLALAAGLAVTAVRRRRAA